MKNKISVIIVAAGKGRRFGSAKQFLELKGKLILDYALEKFEAHHLVDEIILVLEDPAQGEEFTRKYPKIKAIARGGEKRQDSVYSGFKKINPGETDLVLIHDGVRPLVDQELISRVIERAAEQGAAIPVIPIEDTVKKCEKDRVIATLERETLYRVQTPQGFKYQILKEAFQKAYQERYYGTDEASLVERTGVKVYTVEGNPKNIKITNPQDLKIAEFYLEN
ncbi:MAG: 2-C-methyl-D-erythritol 4-phosphate cytidylyltransferase [Candidatus Aminicenantia bacterium]